MDKKLKDENKEMINRINKEKNEEIQKIYKNIKQNIDTAIKNYKKAWEGTEKEVFAEMGFRISDNMNMMGILIIAHVYAFFKTDRWQNESKPTKRKRCPV